VLACWQTDLGEQGGNGVLQAEADAERLSRQQAAAGGAAAAAVVHLPLLQAQPAEVMSAGRHAGVLRRRSGGKYKSWIVGCWVAVKVVLVGACYLFRNTTWQSVMWPLKQ
jgi:hypothetical protein